jgi:hypothetical protein
VPRSIPIVLPIVLGSLLVLALEKI